MKDITKTCRHNYVYPLTDGNNKIHHYKCKNCKKYITVEEFEKNAS